MREILPGKEELSRKGLLILILKRVDVVLWMSLCLDMMPGLMGHLGISLRMKPRYKEVGVGRVEGSYVPSDLWLWHFLVII